MTILEVDNAGFSYQDHSKKIFKDIRLSLSAGQVFCILGPNGAGKTSLLKCIANLLPLSEGSVCYQGEDIRKIDRSRLARKIAYVPQIHYPVFAYTVLETVLMGRTPYLGFFSFPNPKDEKIAQKAVEKLGISHLSDKPYTEISGGERQLVMFARAIAQNPELIILDEPTSHLDYGNQVRILSLIKEFKKSGTAVIMTSHNPDHAFMIADQVGIMHQKAISGFDSPMAVITEDVLFDVYGIKVRLKEDTVFGRICVPALPENYPSQGK